PRRVTGAGRRSKLRAIPALIGGLNFSTAPTFVPPETTQPHPTFVPPETAQAHPTFLIPEAEATKERGSRRVRRRFDTCRHHLKTQPPE
ncbi:MAG: hypothetical protein WAV90_09770, partial [Gordonia amarae]